jgi:threonine dehydrogenase-like Zn-dependent dehydrogenase
VRALRWDGTRLALARDVPDPVPGPGEALAAGRVRVAPLVDAVYPLDDAVAAFDRAATPGTLKVLVDPRAA